jgi:hypothetical protein
MSNIVVDNIVTYWRTGRKTKINSSGWITGNAVCCPHYGESVDRRGRAGVIYDPEGTVSYSCFNCGFRASYSPGFALGYKMRNLLKWMNVSESDIQRLILEAKREQQRQELLGLVKETPVKASLKVSFKPFELPGKSKTISEWTEYYASEGVNEDPTDFVSAVNYLSQRKVDFDKYPFYFSNQLGMKNRVIVPFYWRNRLIGYTARAVNDTISPKYIQRIDHGYVFNIDSQLPDSKFVIIGEGPFDALSVDGVAVLGSKITKQQADIIEDLDREIIVVPDSGKTGKLLIDEAIRLGWPVSFPVWLETCKDINEATVKYGKLFTLKTILDSVEKSSTKIQILRGRYGRK